MMSVLALRRRDQGTSWRLLFLPSTLSSQPRCLAKRHIRVQVARLSLKCLEPAHAIWRHIIDPEPAHLALSEASELLSVGELRVSGLEPDRVSLVMRWSRLIEDVVLTGLQCTLRRWIDNLLLAGV